MLGQVLDLVERCADAYSEATDSNRRQWNQTFFIKLLVDDEVTDDRAAPFDKLLDPNFPRTACAGRPLSHRTVSGPWFKRETFSRGARTNFPLSPGLPGFAYRASTVCRRSRRHDGRPGRSNRQANVI